MGLINPRSKVQVLPPAPERSGGGGGDGYLRTHRKDLRHKGTSCFVTSKVLIKSRVLCMVVVSYCHVVVLRLIPAIPRGSAARDSMCHKESLKTFGFQNVKCAVRSGHTPSALRRGS